MFNPGDIDKEKFLFGRIMENKIFFLIFSVSKNSNNGV